MTIASSFARTITSFALSSRASRARGGARLPIVLLVAAVSLSIGCGTTSSADEEEAEFSYGRDEMRAAIEGTWAGASSTGAPVTLSITYSAPDVQPRCGNRVLDLDGDPSVVSPRCIDMSSVNVTGILRATFGAESDPRDASMRGTFEVMSLRFDGHGLLEAEVDGRRFSATLADGVLDGNLVASGGASEGRLTLRRK